MNKAVIITGSNGGIGAALKAKFSAEGYAVIGIGKSVDAQCCDEYIEIDFSLLVKDADARGVFSEALQTSIEKYELKALINNSATQILASLDELSFDEFQETLGVNVSVPFLLSKISLNYLERGGGSILNIGSIHSKLTKKQFVAYATSKGALEVMTKAMAVDIGGRVRVNMIAPAAIETKMLTRGFENAQDKYSSLVDCHPTGTIGRPEDIACLAMHIIGQPNQFLNGAVIDVSGGISGRLYDPC